MIFEKVNELCDLILETKQYNDFIESEVELENDGEGIDLISNFNQLQEEYVELYATANEEQIESFEQLLEEKHKELLDYPTTGAYIRSKSALDSLLQDVNNAILTSLGLVSEHTECSTCEGGCEDCF